MKTFLAKWSESSLILRILCGLVLGTVLALLFPSQSWIGILGSIFVSALKAIAPILVAVLVMSSVSKAGSGIGSRFRIVTLLYLLSTLVAAIVAVTASFLFPVDLILQDAAAGDTPGGLSEVFHNLLVNMVSNPLNSIATANYLGILFWSVVIGIALRLTASDKAINVVSQFSDTISQVVRWVIQAAPFGILGLVFSAVSENGLNIFVDYGQLLLVLVGSMLFCALVVNPFIVSLFIKGNPYPLVLKCLSRSGLNAFFTRSSAANIPINMELCKELGLDENFYSVSIPLGSTINMNGAAITITVLSLAVCHTLGIEVSVYSAIVLSIIASLGACGASGVAGGSLLLVPMACSLFGISGDIAMQAVGIGFIISVVQDSMETALNSSGDVIYTAAAEIRDRRKNSCTL